MTKMSASPGTRSPRVPGRRVLVLGRDALEPLFADLAVPVQRVRDWPELFALLVREHPASIAVVDPGFDERGTRGTFWELLSRFPSATVVPVLIAGPDEVGRMREMIAGGVSEIINLSVDGEPVVRYRLQEAHARPFKRKLEGELTRFVDPDARILLAAAAEVAVGGGGAGELAEKFAVHRRTLVRWCARCALPEPRRLQAWMRVLLASQLLDDPGRTMEDVAVACGYTTDRSLRRIIKGLLKLDIDVRVLRRTGVFTTAAQSFNEELRALREQRRRSPPSVQPGKVVVPMQSHETRTAGKRRLEAGDPPG